MTWREQGQRLAWAVAHTALTPEAYRASQWPMRVRIVAEGARRDRQERDVYAGIRDVLHTLMGQPLDA